MASIYMFCEYGISLAIIKKLEQKEIDFLDILFDGKNVLKDFWNGDQEKINDLISIAKTIDSQHLIKKNSVFELAKYGVSYLSASRLFELNIPFEKVTDENLLIASGIKSNTIEKIKYAYKKIIDEQTNQDQKSSLLYLKKILYLIASNKLVTFEELKGFLSEYTNYDLAFLNQNLNDLEKNKQIIINDNKIEYKLININDAVEKYTKEKERAILNKRLDGYTLDEIAAPLGISRERVRQIANNSIKKLPKLFEDKYQTMFERYAWEETVFCEFFSVEKRVFNYLKYKYVLGSESLTVFLENPLLNEYQVSVIEKHCGYLRLFGKTIKMDANEVLKAVIEEYAKDDIRIDAISELYNRLVRTRLPDYDIPFFDEKAIEGHASRFDITIFGFGRKLRYYEWSKLTDKQCEKLKKLLDIEDGFYSSDLFFQNNLDFMKEIDIRNEYELHYALRLNASNDNITFLRMPNILVGYEKKEDFLMKKIEELYPISVNEFIKILNIQYGHKTKTMTAYITSAFKDYIRDNTFEINHNLLDEHEIELLKNELTDDIYSFSQVRQIGAKLKIKDVNKLINTPNLQVFGYKARSSYIIKEHINSIDQYIVNYILNQDYYNCDKFQQIKKITVESVIYRLEKNLDIAKIGKKKYITRKKINSLGITNQTLNTIFDQIEKVAINNPFFSLVTIKKETDINKLDKYQLGDTFYKSLISANDKIKTIRVNNDKIFYYSDKTLTLDDFFKTIIGKDKKIKSNSLLAILNNTYGLQLTLIKLKKCLLKTSLIYEKNTKYFYFNNEKTNI